MANPPEGFEALPAGPARRNAVDRELPVRPEATIVYEEAVAEFPVDAGHIVNVVNPDRVKARNRYGRCFFLRFGKGKYE